MKSASYGQFCPVAMASEVLCTRWTIVLIRELVSGSTRFGELRKGVPRMSPTLLSQRLRDLEAAGIVARSPVASDANVHEYRLTRSGEDLKQIVELFGIWGQKWVETRATLENLDPSLLMWDIRRNINPAPLPSQRILVQFTYPELPPSQRDWWLIINPEADVEVDLCTTDPGFEVDLWITTDLKTLTSIWLGLSSLEDAKPKLNVDGDPVLARSMAQWLRLSHFAGHKKLVC